MNRHAITAFTVAAFVGLGGGTALAQATRPERNPAQRASMLADALAASRIESLRRIDSFVRVVGFVWTEQDRPVRHPRLVIRDLTNGQVVDETTGTEAGEFRFEGLSPGSYVIELLGDPASDYTIGTAPSSGGGVRLSTANQGGSTDKYAAPVAVARSDNVLAVSQVLTVVAGDTVGTFIRVSGTLRPGLIFGGSSVFESAGGARVGGVGGGNPASSER